MCFSKIYSLKELEPQPKPNSKLTYTSFSNFREMVSHFRLVNFVENYQKYF